MPSDAYESHLIPLLEDVNDLIGAHNTGSTGAMGRQWRLGGINRAGVVVAVSAWEMYVECLLEESVMAMKPAAPPLGTWPALLAGAKSQIGRFNTPNTQNTQRLFREHIGLPDVTAQWTWKGASRKTNRERLNKALTTRHEVAHGVSPRPSVHFKYMKGLVGFFKRLGTWTDAEVHRYLTNDLGLAPPW
ncbi:MAG: hypothetical protein H6732_04950 [Alphaproteobacteria bacterium]|nr:hypothetical protein [Alphaproteobacteria bacterium]